MTDRAAGARDPLVSTSTSWSWRLDGLLMAALGLFVLLTRWPLRARTLTTVDSVLFALASDHYDVYALRPHAPGYPVYVALVRLGRLVVDDPNAVMVFWSIVFSMLTVLLLYGFGRRLMTRRTALGAAALFAMAPVFVYNGVIAASYTAEAAAGVAIAWLGWELWQNPSSARAAAFGGVFALALGLRPSLLFYFAPLAAFVLLAARPRTRRAQVRRIAVAAAAAVPVGLAWLLPMVHASGGWTRWRTATSLQSTEVVFADAVWARGLDALGEHAWRLGWFLRFESVLLPVLAVALAVWGVARWRTRGQGVRFFAAAPGTPLYVLLWLLPALLFYLLVFNGYDRGPSGYILVVLPGLYLLFAWAVDAALRALPAVVRALWPRLQVGARLPSARWFAVMGVGLLLLPAPTLAAGWDGLVEQEVKNHDEWTHRWLGMKETFPPGETAIAAFYSWAHVKWYFPEYVTWSPLDIRPGRGEGDPWIRMLESTGREDDVPYYSAYEPGADVGNHTIPPGVERVVLFDFQMAGEMGHPRLLKGDVPVEETFLPDGWRVLWFPVDPERPVIEQYFLVL